MAVCLKAKSSKWYVQINNKIRKQKSKPRLISKLTIPIDKCLPTNIDDFVVKRFL